MNSHLHMRKIAVFAGAITLGLAAQSNARADEVTGHASYVNNAGEVVHCVATESGRTYCGKPHMRYVIKSAPTTCIEGTTWGTDERGIWVSGGCNADFDVVADNDKVTTKVTTTTTTTRKQPITESTRVTDSGRVVHCVATASGRTYCGTHHASWVISGTPDPVCVQGSTWGYDERGVWVTGECKGDFIYNDN